MDAVARAGEPLGRPAGIENPTTEDVGKRDFDDEAAESEDCNKEAQDFFAGGAEVFTAGGGAAGAGAEPAAPTLD